MTLAQFALGQISLSNGPAAYGDSLKFFQSVKKISPDSQLSSSITSSISSLRSMRKKVFDDDIWEEFEKI
jgi:hypothetical protein